MENENFSRYIVITYNEFQPTIKVENSGLSYWDHIEGELLQKIVFFLSNVALLSANRAEVGYIFHVPESIQIANWNASVIISNKNLTTVHIFCRVFLMFSNALNFIITIFEGAHFALSSPLCPGLP